MKYGTTAQKPTATHHSVIVIDNGWATIAKQNLIGIRNLRTDNQARPYYFIGSPPRAWGGAGRTVSGSQPRTLKVRAAAQSGRDLWAPAGGRCFVVGDHHHLPG